MLTDKWNRMLLEHKLDAIREHIRNRLYVTSEETQAELNYILDLINRREQMDADWKLSEPLTSVTADEMIQCFKNKGEEQ